MSVESKELDELEENLVQEILQALNKDYDNCPALQEVQPPSTILKLSAEAAAKVMMAFERGYRMNDE